MAQRAFYKHCGCCGFNWPTRESFLSDEDVGLIGYQANFEELKLGFLLFNHHTCDTTLSLMAADFIDLYDGPVHHVRATGGPDCPGFCLVKDNLEPCLAQCSFAPVREVLQKIRAGHRGSIRVLPSQTTSL